METYAPFAELVAMSNKNTPKENGGFTDVSLTRKESAKYVGVSTYARSEELAQWVKDNCTEVKAELYDFQVYKYRNPIDFARRVVVMAILSAQVNFEENLYVMRQVMNHFDDLVDETDIESYLVAPYRGHGNMRKINGYRTKAKYLAEALPWLRTITPDDMTLESVRSLKGVGPKIAAFSMALWDASLPVFTIDAWMVRVSAVLSGQNPRINPTLSEHGYSLIEGDWLAWCRTWLPNLPPFLVQWTVWNGCFGTHKSHLGIIS